LAAEEGARAMADVEQKAIAVRKNMARFRALREAKEVEEKKTAVAKKKRKAPETERDKGQAVNFVLAIGSADVLSPDDVYQAFSYLDKRRNASLLNSRSGSYRTRRAHVMVALT
jgi:hypothetical protein